MATIRDVESETIKGFVKAAADDGYLSGRVLDFGAGKQPYRDIVEEAGGEYEPFDRAWFPANVSGEDVGDAEYGDWHDAVLCTQVVQYVPDPRSFFTVQVPHLIRPGGHLVMTYPTHWPEVEFDDLWRFTMQGMTRLLEQAGFEIIEHRARARTPFGEWGEYLYLGYGVIARRIT